MQVVRREEPSYELPQECKEVLRSHRQPGGENGYVNLEEIRGGMRNRQEAGRPV